MVNDGGFMVVRYLLRRVITSSALFVLFVCLHTFTPNNVQAQDQQEILMDDLLLEELEKSLDDYYIASEGLEALLSATEYAILAMDGDLNSITIKETEFSITITICSPPNPCITIIYFKNNGNVRIHIPGYPRLLVVCRNDGTCYVKFGLITLCTITNNGGITTVDCSFTIPFGDTIKEVFKFYVNEDGQVCFEFKGVVDCADPHDEIPKDLLPLIPTFAPWLLPDYPWIEGEDGEHENEDGTFPFDNPMI